MEISSIPDWASSNYTYCFLFVKYCLNRSKATPFKTKNNIAYLLILSDQECQKLLTGPSKY